MKHYLQTESAECADNGITIKFIGRRDRFSDDLRELVDNVEKRTKGGNALLLRIAADYSSRGQILRAACSASKPDLDVDSFGRLLNQGSDAGDFSGNVDLLVRTGGESRLSDFLLWECAYAELAFVNTYWPDFNEQALKAILEEYKRRDRRFGRIPNTLAAIPVCETP